MVLFNQLFSSVLGSHANIHYIVMQNVLHQAACKQVALFKNVEPCLFPNEISVHVCLVAAIYIPAPLVKCKSKCSNDTTLFFLNHIFLFHVYFKTNVNDSCLYEGDIAIFVQFIHNDVIWSVAAWLQFEQDAHDELFVGLVGQSVIDHVKIMLEEQVLDVIARLLFLLHIFADSEEARKIAQEVLIEKTANQLILQLIW